ncbi:hypothetical protein [Synechococcus sp. MIT S1220]|uniref:hypothetical protein n=1 Tax=Synechococcus sp. MIT S1220 TaxID=3082549 RepID=UPI0039B08E21
MSERYSATLLTDSTYALATIVTANEIAKTNLFERIEIFLFPPFENLTFFQALYNIACFQGVQLSIKNIPYLPYKGIVIGCHFNDTVMAKLVTPYAQENNISMFIDSGFWIVNQAKAKRYLTNILEEFSASRKPIGAIATSSDNNELNRISAALILWNKRSLTEINFLNRSIEAFNKLRSEQKLRFPEQDILQQILTPDEVFILDTNRHWSTMNLDQKFQHPSSQEAPKPDSEKPLFKFTGHFKPWITILLNPLKKLFLDKVSETGREIKIDLIHCFEFYDHRQNALREFHDKQDILHCNLDNKNAIIEQLKYIDFLAK